jgi:hypothetical protein
MMYENLLFGNCSLCNENTVLLRAGRCFTDDALCERCDMGRYASVHPDGKWMVWKKRLENMDAPMTAEVRSILNRDPFTPAFQAGARVAKRVRTPKRPAKAQQRRPMRPAVSQPRRRVA